MYSLFNSSKPPKWTDKIIFFCHGNTNWIGNCIEKSHIELLKGHTVLLIDYRSFGISTGDISETGLYLDVLTMWNYMINTKNVKVSDVILFGNSLGTSLVSYLAYTLKINKRKIPKHIILTSPFYNFYTISKDRFKGIGSFNCYNFPTNKFLNYILNILIFITYIV